MKQNNDSTAKLAVYRITNTANGKVYIGQTNNPRKRLKEHLGQHRPDCWKFKRAVEKYGRNAFKMVILSWHDTQQEADQAEIDAIKTHNSVADGYNIRSGGNGPGVGEDNHMFGRKRPDIAEWNRRTKSGVKWTEEQKARLRGRPMTEETRAKKSVAMRGRKMPENFVQLMTGHTNPRARRVKLTRGIFSLTFQCGRYAAKFLGANKASIPRALTRNKKLHGWLVEYA